MIAIFGGGDIAERGIIPIVGGEIVACDVTNWAWVEAECAKRKPEIVINCAGISRPATIAESNPQHWTFELEVNLLGSYHVAKAAPDATVVLIASVAGLYGKPNHSGYCASKAGVRALVQSLAMEGRDAYCISPGRVDTKMRERDYPGEDYKTRLDPMEVGIVVKDCLLGVYEPGDNVIVRKQGYETFVRVDRGEPWREYLRVGEPPVC